MRFPYAAYELAIDASRAAGTPIYRPEIPFRVIGRTGEELLHGLLDTGVDQVALPRSIGESIGAEIDPGPGWAMEGFAGQSAQAAAGRVIFEVTDGIQTVKWEGNVAFVDYPDPADEQIAILGREGFLEFFNAQFLGLEHAVVLRRNRGFPKAKRDKRKRVR